MNNNPQARLLERLSEFIKFEQDIRAAQTIDALGFIATNSIRKQLDYDTAVLLISQSNGMQSVRYVSGVSSFDPKAPLLEFCERLVNHSEVQVKQTAVHKRDRLPTDLGNMLHNIQLDEVATASLGAGRATMVFIRESPWQLAPLQLIDQCVDAVGHALSALQSSHAQIGVIGKFRKLTGNWKSGWKVGVAFCLCCAFIPVRQSVIAEGQITAKSTTVVASELNGVIKEVLVEPNEAVEKGQLLVRFDNTELTLQEKTLAEELRLAQEHLRKAQQRNLSASAGEANSSNRFSGLRSQIELKTLELSYVRDMISRLNVRAHSNGIAVFGRTRDWVGRAVSTGEKIMEIADSSDQQFEIWVAANDAIDLPAGSSVKFFPDAFPLRSVDGSVDTVSYFATPGGKQESLAFRVLAGVENRDERVRLGMRGTVRLYGDRVALAYYVFRKPLSAIRKTVGV